MPRPSPYGWQNIQPGALVPPGTSPPTGVAPPSRKWRRLLIAGLLVGALSGLTVYVIWMWARSEYPNLVIVAPHAPSSLAVPDNAGGITTGRVLAEFCNDGKHRPKLNAPPISDSKDRDGWKKHLNAARGGGLAVYFAASGATDAGGPFLWWPPAEPATALTEADKLRVTDILAELKGKSGPKLLVFDLTPGPLPWAANGAASDFARALKELDSQLVAVADLAVICSGDADETPWHWDAARTSVFGHYFAQAIQGAGLSGNAVVKADGAFEAVKRDVYNWSKKRRAVSQTPILLPAAEGEARARAMTLAKVPPTGVSPIPPPPEPKQDRTALEREWAAADKELVHPERLDPEGYKQYLGWLLRWEQLVRDGTVTDTLPNPVADLRARLARAAERDVPLVSLAVPQPSAKTDQLDIDRLWKATDDTALRAEWKRQTDDSPRPEHARRAAELLFAKLDAVGHARPNLEKAVRLLDAIEAGMGQRPVETHLVRMLAKHLDPLTPPDMAIMKRAVALSRLAERAAWSGFADGHAEVAFRWTRATLEAADRERRLGEDLLFAGDPKGHAEAGTHFATAEKRYAECLRDAGVIADALAARSRVLIRLPFYARWVADAHRSTRRSEDGNSQLLGQSETAFWKAHELDALLVAPPLDATQRADALLKMKPATVDANAAFDAVANAYELEIDTLLRATETQPESWHALDAAANVPFLTADRRSKLFDKFERVTRGLDQPGAPLGTTPPPVAGNGIAARHTTVARALLGGAASDIPPADGNNVAALRAVADQIGKRFRSFPDTAKGEMAKVGDAKPLTLAEPPLADAARRTRLADPSAPVAASVDPVVADRRYWRHRYLLWQADRAIADGWADVGTITPVVAANQPINTTGWHATRTAGVLADRARAAVLGILNAPTAEQTTRLTEDCTATANRRPNVVLPTAAATYTVIKDYPRWTFGFDVSPAKLPTGHPALWVELPDEYRPANPETVSTREAYRGGGKSAARSYFTPKQSAGGKQELVSSVLYRGHLAKWATPVAFTGDATIEYVHVPPTDDARLAVVADDKVIGGAVVILIDRSASMKWYDNGHPDPAKRGQPRETSRTSLAVTGLRKLLDALPIGTSVTVGGFYLNGETPVAEAIAGPVEIDENDRWEKLGLTATKLDAIPFAETPIAWSIQQVLDKERGKTFWPTNYVGARSLVVLTDGEDNYDEKRNEKPAATILRAVTRKDHDTRVHLVFFAMDAADEKAAKAQFTSLEDPAQYGPGKLPVKLWPGVKNGDEFAAKLRDQFRPRVVYARVGDARADSGQLTATVKNAGTGNTEPSPVLKSGEYKLTSGAWEGFASLAPGDQLVLKAVRAKIVGFELTVPPTAFDLTSPVYKKAGTADNPLRLSVPRVAWDGPTAALTVSLERAPTVGQKAQRLNRPLFPWLDITDPANPGTLRKMRVQNDPTLVAPAWSVRLPNWDSGADQTVAVTMPTVTGFWIDPRTVEAVTPRSAGKFRASDVLEVPTEPVPGLTARKVPTNDGPLLILEVDYKQAGQFPYLLAAWAGTAPPQLHRYYDPQHRYTATFGPLSPDQENREIGFQLYAVADLRKAADSATVELPAMKSTDKAQDATVNLRFGGPK